MSSVIPDPAATDWVPLGGIGQQGAWTPIQEIVLSAAAANIDFSNIPQTYRDLQLRLLGRSDGALANIGLRFNGDAGANYDRLLTQLINAATPAPQEGLAQSTAVLGYCTANAAAAGLASPVIADIPNYADPSYHKTVMSNGLYRSAAATGGIQGLPYYNAWRSAAAINRITLIPSVGNFAAGYRAALYALLPPGVTYLPATGPRFIAGRVNANGTIASGSGFTVTKTGTGQYTITFTTAFAVAPAVVASNQQPYAQSNQEINAHSVSTTGFFVQTVTVASSSGSFTDHPFSFVAIGS